MSEEFEILDNNGHEIKIDIEELISHIDIVQYVSQYLELEEKGGEYWANCPFHDGDNNASFAINPEKQMWFCQGCKRGGTIISFYKLYNNVSTAEAISQLCKYANLDISELKAPPDIIGILRRLTKSSKKENNFVRKPLKDDVMIIYEKRPIKEWLAEGISQEVLDKYQVRYCDLDNSIVFPIFDNDGNIINIKKRNLETVCRGFKKPKYVNIHKVGKLDYLYGFANNKGCFSQYKSLILFESEKSVMKLESAGFYNSLALSTSSISREQANTLIATGKQIVIAMDKDISLEHIYRNFGYLINFTNTYVIIDRDNLLGEKDSPIDKGIEVFMELYKKRVKL